MSDTWLIGDTHFGYEKLLSHRDSDGNRVRPFDSTYEMDEFLVERWNSVVKPWDHVIHVGDVMNYSSETSFEITWSRLNGTKQLLVGNHDNVDYLVRGGFFQECALELKVRPLRLHLSHIPLHPSQLETGKVGSGVFFCNVHGHIHHNPSPEGLYINVSADYIGFAPVNIEVIAEQAKKLLDQ